MKPDYRNDTKISISKDKLNTVINHLRNAEIAMRIGDQSSALAAVKISDNILSYAIFGECQCERSGFH